MAPFALFIAENDTNRYRFLVKSRRVMEIQVETMLGRFTILIHAISKEMRLAYSLPKNYIATSAQLVLFASLSLGFP